MDKPISMRRHQNNNSFNFEIFGPLPRSISTLLVILVVVSGFGYLGVRKLSQSKAATQDANGCETVQTMSVNGKSRQFIVHQPNGITGKPAVVILLHGSNGSACTMESTNLAISAETYDNVAKKRFEDLADQNKFLAVYATALPNSNGVRSWQANTHNTEDTQFMGALIDRAVASYNADANRVYVVGNSSGAFMSYALACDLSTRLAGAVAISGSFFSGMPSGCKPTRAIPFLDITSTADTVKYNYCASIGQPTSACNGNTQTAYDSSYAIGQLASSEHCSGSGNNWVNCGGGTAATVQLQLTSTCPQTNCHAWHGVFKTNTGSNEWSVSQTVWNFLNTHSPSSTFSNIVSSGGGSGVNSGSVGKTNKSPAATPTKTPAQTTTQTVSVAPVTTPTPTEVKKATARAVKTNRSIKPRIAILILSINVLAVLTLPFILRHKRAPWL